MNIFIFENDIDENVKMYCNKHVIKMILETAQILSTNARILSGKKYSNVKVKGKNKKHWYLLPSDDYYFVDDKLIVTDYKIYSHTHENHPCTIWARDSRSNANYLLDLYMALHDEWNYRYKHNKLHKSFNFFGKLMEIYDKAFFINDKLTTFAMAMPEKYICNDPIKSYRKYFNGEKQHIAKWKNRSKPNWYKNKKEMM